MAEEGIVLELQRDCLNAEVPISAILRKSKAIAAKLELNDLLDWINTELDGYTCSVSDLPSYRKGVGSPKFWNPYRGYCPIMVRDDRVSDLITTVFLSQGVGELEDLSHDKTGTLIYQYPPKIQTFLQTNMTIEMECSLHFSASQVRSVLDYVRNKVLDWTLQLEAHGIIGERFSFNQKQKQEAVAVTNHIYGSNIGVLGAVSGDVKNSRFMSSADVVDFSNLRALHTQISEAVLGLPAELIPDIKQSLVDLDGAIVGKDKTLAKRALFRISEIVTGASGNLVAAAILAAIGAQ